MKAGWEYRSLGDVCDIIGGGTPSKDNASFYDNGTVPWATVRDMKSDVISETEFKITNVAVSSSSTNIIPKGNIVIATRVGLGKVCLLAQDTAINQDLKGIIPKDTSKLMVGYLFQWFKNNAQVIIDEGTGATVQGVKLPFIKSLIIPIPPIEEQQRIVGILDEAFEGIATATANAEKNLHNARALFESHLQSVFSQRGEGWVEKQLEEIVDGNCTLSYGIVQPGNDYTNGLPVVRPTDLTSKLITPEGLKLIDPKLAEGYRRTTLRGGELLLCVRGSTGVISVAAPELVGANVTRGIVPIMFNPDLLRQDFGCFLMTSEPIQNQIREKTYGAALMQINIGDLRKIVVSYPNLSVQAELSERLQDISTETHHLKSIYQQKLSALDALKKSLLDQAFRGEL
jgi:type I restriction enzyme S subunit